MLGLKILAPASPHRISIELSQDRKIQVGRDRENKTLITLTLEIALAKVMYPQYLSFSLQQYGAKFCQLRGDVIYNPSFSILLSNHPVMSTVIPLRICNPRQEMTATVCLSAEV